MDDWIEEKESLDLLHHMFPHVAGGNDVMGELCPDGWQVSHLRLALHPSSEQLWEEYCRISENLNRLRRDRPPDPPLDREAFFLDLEAKPCPAPEPDQVELAHLVGLCLWDILSDNHDLVCPDGRVRHMGSFRRVGGLLYEWIDGSQDAPEPEIDFADWRNWDMGYMDYFMGTIHVGGRTDLSPVYRMIFKRLRDAGYGWRYTFPRLQAIRLSGPGNEPVDLASYDPSESFAREQEEAEREKENARLQEDLERVHRDALEEAKLQPPPPTVSAFRNVFDHWPEGWPPWEAEG